MRRGALQSAEDDVTDPVLVYAPRSAAAGSATADCPMRQATKSSTTLEFGAADTGAANSIAAAIGTAFIEFLPRAIHSSTVKAKMKLTAISRTTNSQSIR